MASRRRPFTFRLLAGLELAVCVIMKVDCHHGSLRAILGMIREDSKYIVSITLLVSIVITGTLGYIQSGFELRKFIPHTYFAYLTLSLAGLHVTLNFKKLWRYLSRRSRRQPEPRRREE